LFETDLLAGSNNGSSFISGHGRKIASCSWNSLV
jgi:hypothetical protein